MKHSIRFGGFAVVVAMVMMLRSVAFAQGWPDPSAPEVAQAPDAMTSFGLRPGALPGWFQPDPPSAINGWIAQQDLKSMTFHAWKLWAAVTVLTPQRFRGAAAPVFLTWWPQGDVFASDAEASARAQETPRVRFERPRQFQRFQHLLAETTTPQPLPGNENVNVVVTVQYNPPMYRHVRKHQYYDPNVLQNINNGWSASTPLQSWNLAPFPATSVMTKPSYLFAYANQPTQMQYWTGPADSITPSSPGYGTWTNWMWVLPPGWNVDQFKQTQADGHPVVSVNDFFHFALTAEDFLPTSPLEGASLFPNNPLTGSGFNPGDYAILVAMHLSSREIADWTWQTFFWSLTPSRVPAGLPVAAPFHHYQAAVGYSFTTDGSPDSLPTVCYNPYLEAGFDNTVFSLPGQLGIESNCMSCHRAAVWPAIAPASAPAGTINPGYVSNGLIDPANAYLFGGQTKTDFVWGVQDNIAPPAASP